MSFSIKYKEFFRVDILHRYFLDKGLDRFETMSPADQEKQLAAYDHRLFFEVQPAPETTPAMNGNKLVLRKTNRGISVWGEVSESNPQKPFIDLNNDLTLTFYIRLADPKFVNYTNLRPQDTMKLYYFSNKRPHSEPPAFPLIGLSGSSSYTDEKFILSSGMAKSEGSLIPAGLRNNIFGIIRIFVKGENSAFDVTDYQGEIPVNQKIFEIQLDNRKTWWRYIYKTNQTVLPADDVIVENGDARTLITKNEYPLTSRGFIPVLKGGNELPNAGVSSIVPDRANNKIYSEIFM